MRKWAVITGLVILLIGLVLIPNGNKAQVEFKTNNSKIVEGQWSVSDYFTKGVNITLDFQQSYDWSLPQYEIFDDPPFHRKYLLVNVTDTVADSIAIFRVTIVAPRGIMPPTLYTTKFEVYPPVDVIQHGTMNVEDQTQVDPELGINLGVTLNNGLYIVTLSFEPFFAIVQDTDLEGKMWIHETFPPAVLRVRSVSTQTNYPYAFLLPLGASVCIIGAVLAVWGHKSSKHKAIRKESPR